MSVGFVSFILLVLAVTSVLVKSMKSLWILISLWSTCIAYNLNVRGTTERSTSPRFITKGQTYRVVIGDTVLLPCEVENLGSYVLLWRRGSSVLTAGTIMVIRDPRFRLVDGFNLQISKVMPQDAGNYICQIGDGDNRDQIHSVEVLVPPTIRSSSSTGQLTARKGGTITLECRASGNPVPSILWSRKDKTVSVGENILEGFSITLEKVDRHQAGVYQCTASNGVGTPVSVDMQLDVLYPPEIEVERNWIHAGEGDDAKIVCVVHGEPPPNVSWYQDDSLVDVSERHSIKVRGSKHILSIHGVRESDFGNYSCVAENSLGSSAVYMQLSGRPSPVKFLGSPYSHTTDSYNLTWAVESNPELSEIRLLYRKLLINDSYQRPDIWHEVKVKPSKIESISKVMSHNICGLEPSSVFQALVQVRNRYGWSEVSELYQFYTRGPDEDMYEPNMELMSSKSWTLSWPSSALRILVVTSLISRLL